MRTLSPRFLALLAFAFLSMLAASCGGTAAEVAPVVTPGPAPALEGAWDVTMPRGAGFCSGSMTIDGATGTGTYVGCDGVTGTLVGSVDAGQAVVLLFKPAGYESYWMTGRLFDPTWIGGTMHGVGWRDEVFEAHRR